MFAAVHAWKSITNLELWYNEMGPFEQLTLRKECHDGGSPQSPTNNVFCYERRSSVFFASNYVNVPISMTHSYKDTLVSIRHSERLRDLINSFTPVIPCVLYTDWSAAWKCTAPWHCVDPEPAAVLDYLQDFTRNPNPDRINITTDESKAYYWMKVVQTGGDHWSNVQVTRDPHSPTIQVQTDDTRTMSLGFNMGSASIPEYVTSQPGLGFPATTYLVKGAGHNYLADYSSGYLTTQINLTGVNTFTISALDISVGADPAVVMDDQPHTSVIAVDVYDQSSPANPVPNGTSVLLQTTEGRFPNGGKIYAMNTTNGRVTTTLTVQPTDDLATITATVGKATGTGTVDVLHSGLGLDITPEDATAYKGVPVNLEYRVTNTGDSQVHAIVVTDDDGNGGLVTVCQGITLAPKQSTTCPRSITLSHTAIVNAQATGLTTLGDSVSGSDGARITVINPSIALTSSPNPLVIGMGESATLTYRVTNTGNATLTAVKVVDDNGGGGSYTSCSGRTLEPGATTTCTRSVYLGGQPFGKAFTYTATATGRDPLNNTVQIQTQTTVMSGSLIYLPYTIRSQ
jgi:hypothetical protein